MTGVTSVLSAHPPTVAGVDTRVSVVIPCFNEGDFIFQLLDAVRAQDTPLHEVIVVDNGSTDETVAIVRRYAQRHPGFPLSVISCAHEGAAAAMNAGIGAASGDAIVRLDGHSCPRPDYVRLALRRLAEADAGVVGGVWEIAAVEATAPAAAIAAVVSHPLGSGGAAYRHAEAHQGPRDVDTVPFGCFTRAHWAALGGYDDRLLVVEDGEFNYRTRVAGRRVVLDPAVRSVYFARPTLGALAAQYFKYGWWKVSLLLAHPGALRIRQVVPLVFVSAWLVLAALAWIRPEALVMLAALAAVYGGSIAVAAARIARSRRRWDLWLPAVCAFAVIHFCWGSGALVHAMTLGAWPRWREAARR